MSPSDRIPSAPIRASGRLALFGYEPTEAVVELRRRSRRWRVGGAVRMQAAGLLAAPLVGLVPPHAPWAIGALGVGFVLARRRLRHRFTVEAVRGACPRCGATVSAPPGMLRIPHPVACPSCHHESSLELSLPVEDLPGAEGEDPTPAPP